jgi:hypothetical protein
LDEISGKFTQEDFKQDNPEVTQIATKVIDISLMKY